MKVAAATSCSNEGRYLLEWVAHHFLLGFTRFYIFTHNNTEDEVFLDAKEKLLATGMVSFHESVRTGENRCFQMENFCRARDFCRDEAIDWLWCADLDEYLVLTNHQNVIQLLGGVSSNVAQISFSWLIYGSNGQKDFDADTLHFERFTRHAPLDHEDHIYVKSFVRVKLAGTMHLHLHQVLGPRLNGALKPLKITGKCSSRPVFIHGFVAHFSIRSRGEFEFKQNRGYASAVHETLIDEEYWSRRDRNELAGPPMTYHIMQLRSLLQSWKAGSPNLFSTPNPNLHENHIIGYPHGRGIHRPCA